MATLGPCRPPTGGIEAYTTAHRSVRRGRRRAFNRVAFAAAHVVADPLADAIRGSRRRSTGRRRSATADTSGTSGFGVAEAMDTAQRGMGLGWPEAKALIGRALEAAKGRPGA